MTQFMLPSVLTQEPTKEMLKSMGTVKFINAALRVAQKIYIRCQLAEAQNWRCCF